MLMLLDLVESEPFQVASSGIYFAHEMGLLRQRGQIGRFPLIPGDNDKQGPPQTPTPSGVPNLDAPDNLTRIQPDPNGDVTITTPPVP